MRGERDEKEKGEEENVKEQRLVFRGGLSVFILYKTRPNDLGLYVHECVFTYYSYVYVNVCVCISPLVCWVWMRFGILLVCVGCHEKGWGRNPSWMSLK